MGLHDRWTPRCRRGQRQTRRRPAGCAGAARRLPSRNGTDQREGGAFTSRRSELVAPVMPPGPRAAQSRKPVRRWIQKSTEGSHMIDPPQYLQRTETVAQPRPTNTHSSGAMPVGVPIRPSFSSVRARPSPNNFFPQLRTRRR